MWKRFNYKETERVAYVPEVGPAYQILPKKGFRAFSPEGMGNVKTAANLFAEIPEEIFGPELAAQDGYFRQVRMPEPPLLLADRMTGIDAETGKKV